jgi:hypothetical protein
MTIKNKRKRMYKLRNSTWQNSTWHQYKTNTGIMIKMKSYPAFINS